MKLQGNKILVICGPTATGKTALGVRLSRKFGGEIISADSRQVYKGMDIGTGKDLSLYEHLPVWLMDIASPNRPFSVADYRTLAVGKIKDIWQRGRLPILVGGSGFYIKAVIDGLETMGIPQNLELRKILTGKSSAELFEQLESLDPLKAGQLNVSDRQNPRRLIRAIEVARFLLEHKDWHSESNLETDVFFVCLTAPREVLYQRIDKRVHERKETGLIEEIKTLLKRNRWDSSVLSQTIGYKEWQPFFEGKETEEQALAQWMVNEHAYARRQLTWFKKDKRINWFDITKVGFEEKIADQTEKWYHHCNGKTGTKN